MSAAAPDTPASAYFTARQWAIIVLFGVTVWFLGAVLLRAVEPLGVYQAPGIFILYAAMIPGTWPVIWLGRMLARARREQTALVAASATGFAIACDANALVWWPALYGHNIAGAGAAILWGGAVAIGLGLWMGRPGNA